MVIIDLSQITFSNLFMHIKKHEEINEELLRYMILNSIRAYNAKLFKGYGEVIIACDSKENWRKTVFPYYKANRKKKRDESTINWTQVFEALDTIKQELKDYFPYTVIDVDGVEADDIIATLSKLGEETLILSGDLDFIQLHTDKIKQFSPTLKKYIKSKENPTDYLKIHILQGDSGDGVPNVCSADDTFVLNKRQKRLTSKKLKYLIECEPEDYTSVEQRNYYRNKQLIDLSLTPEEYKLSILEAYNNRPKKNKSKLFNYFFDKKLVKFISSIQDF